VALSCCSFVISALPSSHKGLCEALGGARLQWNCKYRMCPNSALFLKGWIVLSDR